MFFYKHNYISLNNGLNTKKKNDTKLNYSKAA